MATHTPVILLIEDDPALADLMAGALQVRGYATHHADHRAAALSLLNDTPEIAVVLLDLGLPPHQHDMSEGLAVLAAIHASGHPAKVIVLTGQDQEAAALQAIRGGAFDFLGKPAPMAAIQSAVERALLFGKKESELNQQGITRIQFNAVIGEGLKQVRDDAEEQLVRQVLRETHFNIHESARRLGIKRENVYYFLKKFGIVRQE
jgi:DNA-binding NtrC family response regulator